MIELQAIEDPQCFDVVLGEIPGAHMILIEAAELVYTDKCCKQLYT